MPSTSTRKRGGGRASDLINTKKHYHQLRALAGVKKSLRKVLAQANNLKKYTESFLEVKAHLDERLHVKTVKDETLRHKYGSVFMESYDGLTAVAKNLNESLDNFYIHEDKIKSFTNNFNF
jgi:hypothetical protein